MAAAAGQIESDPGYQKAQAELENGAEPPYDSAQRVLLQATAFSPEIVPLAERPKSLRYFELRIYHSPTINCLTNPATACDLSARPDTAHGVLLTRPVVGNYGRLLTTGVAGRASETADILTARRGLKILGQDFAAQQPVLPELFCAGRYS